MEKEDDKKSFWDNSKELVIMLGDFFDRIIYEIYRYYKLVIMPISILGIVITLRPDLNMPLLYLMPVVGLGGLIRWWRRIDMEV